MFAEDISKKACERNKVVRVDSKKVLLSKFKFFCKRTLKTTLNTGKMLWNSVSVSGQTSDTLWRSSKKAVKFFMIERY